MTNTLVLCVLLNYFSAILCGQLLVPKDTSYGFVPRDSKIVKYNSDHDQWRPYSSSGGSAQPSYDSDSVVINAPGVRNSPSSPVSNETSVDNRTQQDYSRSLRFPRPSTVYYYEPPPVYLPPSENVPVDYTTSAPTDEEFINRPSHDDVPQDAPDVPFQGYNYVNPVTPYDDLLPPSHDYPIIPPSPQYLPVDPPSQDPQPYYPPYGVTATKTGDPNNSLIKKHSSIVDETILEGRRFKQNGPLNIEVSEMHCFDTPTDGRFQALLTVKSQDENVPVFEEANVRENSPCVVKSDSVPPRYNSKLRINIPKGQFRACAVKDCSTTSDVVHLCVKLRFPTISRMKLAEDTVLTLQCRTQDRIAAHTKHLAIDVDNSLSGRSSEVARGGARGGLRSRMGLYRKGPRGDHSEPVPKGARVPLGELLMLRAQIEPEDGWTASRLSTVSMSGGSLGALPLLGSDGCRLSGARALCPREPQPAPPLAHTLLIRAALFEGMRSGEEIRLSVRIMGCLDPSDCRSSRCGPGRSRRYAPGRGNNTLGNHTLGTTSVLSFKVVLPGEEEDRGNWTGADMDTIRRTDHTPVVVMLMVLCATIICSSLLIFIKTRGRWMNRGS